MVGEIVLKNIISLLNPRNERMKSFFFDAATRGGRGYVRGTAQVRLLCVPHHMKIWSCYRTCKASWNIWTSGNLIIRMRRVAFFRWFL